MRSRRVTAAIFAFTIATSLITADVFAAATKKARPYKQYTIEQFMTSTTVSRAAFSPDEAELLFTSNESGVSNVYTVPVKGGKAKPLTASASSPTRSVSSVSKSTP